MEKTIAEKLRQGMVGVIPTDTVYGIVASARMPMAVSRVYALRKRDENKPCIILLSDAEDLNEFGIVPTDEEMSFMEKQWPGAVSILFPCKDERFSFLHCGVETLAFRVPDSEWLRNLLRATGPLIAPSANIQGKPAALDRDEVDACFHSQIDFLVDGGKLTGEPSTIVQFKDGQIQILRSGRVKL